MQTINSQRDVDGHVQCPDCETELGEANMSVCGTRGGVGPAKVSGAVGNLWVHAVVQCYECQAQFEVGGQVGVTALPDDV